METPVGGQAAGAAELGDRRPVGGVVPADGEVTVVEGHRLRVVDMIGGEITNRGCYPRQSLRLGGVQTSHRVGKNRARLSFGLIECHQLSMLTGRHPLRGAGQPMEILDDTAPDTAWHFSQTRELI